MRPASSFLFIQLSNARIIQGNLAILYKSRARIGSMAVKWLIRGQSDSLKAPSKHIEAGTVRPEF